MARFSKNKMILSRVYKLKRTLKVDTQRLRGKSLKALEEMFKMAKKLAQNKELQLRERHKWVQVAAYICQVINSVCKGFDERQIDHDLDELERLVNEAKAKTKAKKRKKSIKKGTEKKASKGSS